MFYKKERGFTPLETIGRQEKDTVSLTGFTVVELLIVIIIIGILAALALPQFNKTKEHAIGKEAVANLKLIAAAEKIYRMETNFYYPYPNSPPDEGNTATTINTNLKLSLTETNWDYSITAVVSSFTAYGDRVDTAPSPYRDCVYSLAHNDADDEPNPNNTTWCP